MHIYFIPVWSLQEEEEEEENKITAKYFNVWTSLSMDGVLHAVCLLFFLSDFPFFTLKKPFDDKIIHHKWINTLNKFYARHNVCLHKLLDVKKNQFRFPCVKLSIWILRRRKNNIMLNMHRVSTERKSPRESFFKRFFLSFRVPMWKCLLDKSIGIY